MLLHNLHNLHEQYTNKAICAINATCAGCDWEKITQLKFKVSVGGRKFPLREILPLVNILYLLYSTMIFFKPNKNQYPEAKPGKGKAKGKKCINSYHNEELIIFLPDFMGNNTGEIPSEKKRNDQPFCLLNHSNRKGININNGLSYFMPVHETNIWKYLVVTILFTTLVVSLPRTNIERNQCGFFIGTDCCNHKITQPDNPEVILKGLSNSVGSHDSFGDLFLAEHMREIAPLFMQNFSSTMPRTMKNSDNTKYSNIVRTPASETGNPQAHFITLEELDFKSKFIWIYFLTQAGIPAREHNYITSVTIHASGISADVGNIIKGGLL